MKSDFSRFLHYAPSYSGLTRISRWNKFATLVDLDTPVKPECDTMRADAATCRGRSMVEMLGVLAIIGVLSVGAISGYSKAMFKYKLNRHAEAVNMLINNLLQIKGQLQHNPNTTTCYGYLFNKMRLLPDGIQYYDNCDIRDMWFNGSMSIYYANDDLGNGQHNNFGGISFHIPVSSQGEEICRNILFAAKENAANLWLVELVKNTADSGHVYSQAILGDNYCHQAKCLHNMTLNDTEVICNICEGIGCSLYVLYK